MMERGWAFWPWTSAGRLSVPSFKRTVFRSRLVPGSTHSTRVSCFLDAQPKHTAQQSTFAYQSLYHFVRWLLHRSIRQVQNLDFR